MSTKQELPREGSLFSAMSFSEEIVLKNQHIFQQSTKENVGIGNGEEINIKSLCYIRNESA